MKAILALLLCYNVVMAVNRPCDGEPWKSKPWCDVSLSFEDRAKSLTAELTLQEKVSLMGNSASEVPRLNLPKYQWWSEALHGVGKSPGVTFEEPTPYATSFPQTSLTAQSFDRQLFHNIATAISTEARAMSNVGHSNLTFWSPNVNIFRDPRWGRGQETPGEDPYLTSQYAYEFVRGMQEGEDPRYLKSSACCKHYSAYDLDDWGGSTRFDFDAKVTDRDMKDTFQVPFEVCVKKARVSSLMCSYNAINGIPACADRELLYGTARESWGFEGYITADCDAVDTIHHYHHYTNDTDTTSMLAVTATCDVDCGDYYKNYVEHSVTSGKLKEEDVDLAIINLFKVQMRLGLFDPLDMQVYTKYGLEQLNTKEHHDLALQAAREGIALLKNEDEQLPMNLKEKKVVVGGAFANEEEVLLGNYQGIPEHIITLFEGIQMYNEKAILLNEKELTEEDLQQLKEADIVILGVGLSQAVEAEGRDRYDLYLPKEQREYIDKVLATTYGKVILVLITGCGAVDISAYKDDKRIVGIISAGYTGMAGGQAIAEVIVGKVNPSGRLVNTWYYNDDITSMDFKIMNMRPNAEEGYPGRTYRFYTKEVLYPFGYGLSYTTFSHQLAINQLPSSRMLRYTHRDFAIHVSVTVKNTGKRDGSESVLIFAKSPKAGMDGYPLKHLVAFDRVTLGIGEKKTLSFVLGEEELRLVNPSNEYEILHGEWTLQVEEASISFNL